MRVLNVSASFDLKTGGGGAERTFQISRFLAREGIACTILTLNAGIDDSRLAALLPARLVVLKTLWRRFQVPRLSWRTICDLVKQADVIHLMAHWSMLNVFVYLAARAFCKPYVVCPVGTLPIFGRSGNFKRLYNSVAGNAIIRNASAWIAVTGAEYAHFERYGVPTSKVTVIPNGVSEEDFPSVNKEAFLLLHGLPNNAPLILFMGRLNPIKGPDILLRAFARVRDRLPTHHLVFVGPDEGLLPELREIVRKERLSERVHFLGYIDTEEKPAAYRCASLVVIPSRQDAVPIVMLEAGICGTPVLVTDQCGFGEIRTLHPGLEVAATEEGIGDGLVYLLRDGELLETIAPRWREFVRGKYAWESLTPNYIQLYERILGAGLAY